MNMGFQILTPHEGTNLAITAQASDLHLLTAQLAANIIFTCQSYPITGRPGDEGPSGVLAERLDWANHSCLNALQAQVELLYEVAQATAFDSNFRFHVLSSDRNKMILLITDALTAYQALKTRICQVREEECGPGIGSATLFCKMDWTDYNINLKALLLKPDNML